MVSIFAVCFVKEFCSVMLHKSPSITQYRCSVLKTSPTSCDCSNYSVIDCPLEFGTNNILQILELIKCTIIEMLLQSWEDETSRQANVTFCNVMHIHEYSLKTIVMTTVACRIKGHLLRRTSDLKINLPQYKSKSYVVKV